MAEEVNEELLDKMEKSIEDLRNQFEQYFMGSRKRAPEQEKTSLQFRIRRLSNQSISNTRHRFRFQQLVAKFNSYNQYWNRTMQKIESGTYFRDLKRAQLHSGPVDAPPPSPGRRPAAKKDDTDAEVDRLHRELIDARKKLNQSTNISKEKIAQTIKKQAPELKKRYKGREVEFKVVVEDGKAKLKATPK